MSHTRNPFYRDSSIGRVFYRPDGRIEPVRLESAGVGPVRGGAS
jgi:hypothetical protein